VTVDTGSQKLREEVVARNKIIPIYLIPLRHIEHSGIMSKLNPETIV